jgi:hypothetical protein
LWSEKQQRGGSCVGGNGPYVHSRKESLHDN